MSDDRRTTSDRWATEGWIDDNHNRRASMAYIGVMAFMIVLYVIVVATSPSRKDVSAVSTGKGLEPSTKAMKCVLISSTVTAKTKDGVIAIPHAEAGKAALEAMRRWREAHPKASIITTFPVGTPPTEYYVIYVEQE